MCANASILAIQCEKKFWPATRFELCTPDLTERVDDSSHKQLGFNRRFSFGVNPWHQPFDFPRGRRPRNNDREIVVSRTD